jgi:hypothetical protein
MDNFFGASGILSMELAILMMQHNTFIGVPFAEAQKTKPIESIDQCSRFWVMR